MNQFNNDENYRNLTMRRNGLAVFLISEPTAIQSVAMMRVKASYYEDPENLPGLSHLCEHMLFKKSEKYPSNFIEFLDDHGGEYNASVSMDTHYIFRIDCQYLEEALDRFANLFISPLFDPDDIQREIQVIQAEFERNLDTNHSINFNINCRTSDQSNKCSNFPFGNWRTLKRDPEISGINVREELINYYSKFYSANNMALYVISTKTIDELLEMVFLKLPFREIKNKHTFLDRGMRFSLLYKERHLMKEIKIASQRHRDDLIIVFLIPNCNSDEDDWISCEVANEFFFKSANVSLINQLVSKGWIYEMDFQFAGFHMKLTDDGFKKVDEIIKMFFQFINSLKKESMQEWFFEEIRKIKKFTPKNVLQVNPSDLLDDYKRIMVNKAMGSTIESKDEPSNTYQFNANRISKFLNFFRPENMRITLISPKYKGLTTRKERYYSIEYNYDDISKERIEMWNNAGFNENFQLPKPNQFVPTDIVLVKRDTEESNHPKLVKSNEYCDIWYLQDNQCKTCQSQYRIHIHNPVINQDPLILSSIRIYILHLTYYFDKVFQQTRKTLLNYIIRTDENGLLIQIRTYSDKIFGVLDLIIDKLIDGKIDFSENNKQSYYNEQKYSYEFYKIKTWTEKHIYNCLTHPIYLCDSYIDSHYETIQQVTPNTIGKSLHAFFSKIFFTCFVGGNVNSTDVEKIESMKNRLITHYSSKPASRHSFRCAKRLLKLDDHSSNIYYAKGVFGQMNSIVNYHQIEFDTSWKIHYATAILTSFLETKFLHYLRHNLKRVYYSSITTYDYHGVVGISFYVESVLDSQYMDYAIENFLISVRNKVNNMSDSVFESHREFLKHAACYPDDFRNKSEIFWYRIMRNECDFIQADESKLQDLEKVTKQDVIRVFNKHLIENKRKLSIRVVGEKINNENTDDLIRDVIGDIVDEIEFNLDESYMLVRKLMDDLMNEVIQNEIESKSEIPMHYKIIDNLIEFKNDHSLYPISHR